ncbi:hypothetical protein AYO21_06884 [Fonsecaea monophora]|uniref:Uncharacterized protein n=1 Tax=Fonsecaea monophora TaxID=254056 RepID=A0A177F3J9_9EURO|nr:hypothetical protein AYO21_06884 [Fonsecaea monophora]KAH0841235.1 hypothetical protein FOPE_06122 [Fonsecaea pedrosoi]OAG38853.1 hypothetical protein AYO21_06884 [Fonsecaea monophora]
MGAAASAARGAAVVGAEVAEVAAVGAEAAEAVVMTGGAAADGVLGQTAGRIASSSASTEYFSALGSRQGSQSSAFRSVTMSEESLPLAPEPGWADQIYSIPRRPKSIGPSFNKGRPWDGRGFRNHPASEGGAYQNWELGPGGEPPVPAKLPQPEVPGRRIPGSTSTNSEFVRTQIKGKQIASDWYTKAESVYSEEEIASMASEEEITGSAWSHEAADGSQIERFPEYYSPPRTPSHISSTGASKGSAPKPLTDSEEWLRSSESSSGTVVHHTPPNNPNSMEAIDGSAEWLSGSEPESVAEASIDATYGSSEGELIEGEVVYDGHPLGAESPASGESTGTVIHHRPAGAAAASEAEAVGPKKWRRWQDLWTPKDILSFPPATRFNVLRGQKVTEPIFFEPGAATKPDAKTFARFEKAVRHYIKKEGAFTGEEVSMLFGKKPGQLTGAEFVQKIGKPFWPKKAAKLNAMSGPEFSKLTAPELQKLLPAPSRSSVGGGAVGVATYGMILAGYVYTNTMGELHADKMKDKYKDIHKRSEIEPDTPEMARGPVSPTTLVVTEGLTWMYTDPLPTLGIYTVNDTTSSVFDGDYITVPMSQGTEYALSFPPEVQRIHLTNASPRPICVAGINITTSDKYWTSLSGNLGDLFNADHYETGQQVMNGSTSCTWIDQNPEGIGIAGLTFELVDNVHVPVKLNGTLPVFWLSNDTLPEDLVSDQELFDFTEHLVKSQLTKSSAKRLCENQYSQGPHFVSLNEKLYCDMEARQIYPTCGNEAGEGVCFDVDKDKLVEPEEGDSDEDEAHVEGEVQVDGVRGSFAKRRVAKARRSKVVKSFKHVHVWE